jgi:two-component system alkaline phosphatase synthesis response regulator PhoP
MKPRILIIEDDSELVELLRSMLADEQLALDWAADGEEGLGRVLSGDYALVIIDYSLPGMNGLEVCRSIRSTNERLPIMMLTSRAEEVDRVLGLELGADDYVVKPVGVRELIARIKAILRRAGRTNSEPSQGVGKQVVLTYGELQIDMSLRAVCRDGKRLNLTALESSLLELLLQPPGRTCTREELIEGIWGYYSEALEANLNSTVRRLRAKIESDPTKPRHVVTAVGIGYRWDE